MISAGFALDSVLMDWKMKIIYPYLQLCFLNSAVTGYRNARLAKKGVKAELGIINNKPTKVVSMISLQGQS